MQKGNIGVTTENIFPVIKKFLYSDHEIFLRELVSNAVDATQKLKTLASIGEFKALGQWGYARNGNSQPNDAILFLRDTNRGNAPWGPGVLTTQFGINIQTQGAVDQSGLPGGAGVNRGFYPNRNGYGANTAIYSCGVNWSELVELYAKMNTIGSDNGIYRIWYGGTLILEYTNCRFRDATNPRGFRARHWNPVLGGGGPGAKTRRDVLDIMFLELWFGGQID